MKISEERLNQIIKEEIDAAIEEGFLDRLKARASGAAAGPKALMQRAAGAARYAATGEAPSTAGKIKGSYKHAKKTKIIDLHKKKVEQMLLKMQPMINARIEEMEKDLAQLGVADSEGAQKIIAQLRELSQELPELQSDFSRDMGALLQQVGAGEITQEE